MRHIDTDDLLRTCAEKGRCEREENERMKEAARRISEVSAELHLTVEEYERVLLMVKKRAVISIAHGEVQKPSAATDGFCVEEMLEAMEDYFTRRQTEQGQTFQ